MNIHKEEDKICILADDIYCYEILKNGSLERLKSNTDCEYEYQPYDNFYIHSGQEEIITYNTIAPDGRIIVVNTFRATIPNPGIKRVDGSRG